MPPKNFLHVRPRGGKHWTKSEVRLLGTMFDGVVARTIGRTYSAVWTSRRSLRIRRFRIRDDGGWRLWEEWEIALLGTLPDIRLADKIGRSIGSVTVKRRKMGIPACRLFGPWQPVEYELMGQIPDEEIARRYGRVATTVQANALK